MKTIKEKNKGLFNAIERVLIMRLITIRMIIVRISLWVGF